MDFTPLLREARVPWLIAQLLYGAGLRLTEGLRLRVKDIDFTANHLVVREGKGDKDRITMLPSVVKAPLSAHLVRVRTLQHQDLAQGYGRVALPDALESVLKMEQVALGDGNTTPACVPNGCER